MSRKIDHNSYWQIDENPISRTGIFPYLGRQISPVLEPDRVYNVLRPEEELFSRETMDSFKLKPLVNDHCMLGEDFTPAEKHGIHGVLGERIRRKGDFLVANMEIYSETLKNEIRNGKKELSLGYFCDYDITPGTYKGIHYDAVQRNLRGNHIALVDRGRMGHDVRVMDGMRANDAKDVLVYDEMPFVEGLTGDSKDPNFKDEEHPRDENHQKFVKAGSSGTAESKEKEEKTETSKNESSGSSSKAKDTPHYDAFLKKHSALIEKAPETWEGTTKEDVKKTIKFDETAGYAEVKTPVEKIKIVGSDIKHLIEDNEPERRKFLFYALKTMTNPNIVIEDYGKTEKTKNNLYHYYIKLFNGKKKNGKEKTDRFLQIVRIAPDGNFYTTSHPASPGQINNLIGSGKTIYDLSALTLSSLDSTQAVYHTASQELPSKTILINSEQIVKVIDNEISEEFNGSSLPKEKGMKDEKENKNPPEAADPGEKDSAEKTTAPSEGKADEGNKSAPADMPEKKEAKAADNDISRKTDVSRDGEGAKPAKSAQDSIAEAMFAPAALDRLEAEIVSRMESRNRLVSRLKPVIGDFKGDGMTKRGVIEYACDALSLPEKTEAALNACLDRKEKEGIVRVDREGGTPGCAVIERFLRGE